MLALGSIIKALAVDDFGVSGVVVGVGGVAAAVAFAWFIVEWLPRNLGRGRG